MIAALHNEISQLAQFNLVWEEREQDTVQRSTALGHHSINTFRTVWLRWGQSAGDCPATGVTSNW
jgi:hypothetical protein